MAKSCQQDIRYTRFGKEALAQQDLSAEVGTFPPRKPCCPRPRSSWWKRLRILLPIFWNCPADCCIDYITLSSPDHNCFKACAYLVAPVAKHWNVSDQNRLGCDSSDCTLIHAPGDPSLCSYDHLKIRICGDDGTTINYSAHYVCNGGGFITGTITL